MGRAHDRRGLGRRGALEFDAETIDAFGAIYRLFGPPAWPSAAAPRALYAGPGGPPAAVPN